MTTADKKEVKHELKIDPSDPKIVFPKYPKFYSIVGRPGSGKTMLIQSLLHDYFKSGYFRFGMVFSASGIYNQDFKDIVPSEALKPYSSESLEHYVKALENWRKAHNGKKLPPNFIVLDDLLGTIKTNDQAFNKLAALHRQLECTVFITSQYLKGAINPTARTCTNYAFMFKELTKNSRSVLYDAFGQLYHTEEDFLQAFDKATKEKYRALFYNSESEDASGGYFRYKARDPGKFKLKYKLG